MWYPTSERARRQNERAPLCFRLTAKAAHPLLHSSLPSRKSSLRLVDAGVTRRPKRSDNGFGARTACVRARRQPALVAGMRGGPIVPGQFHLQGPSLGESKGGAHIPLWRAFFAVLPRFFPTRERNGVTRLALHCASHATASVTADAMPPSPRVRMTAQGHPVPQAARN